MPAAPEVVMTADTRLICTEHGDTVIRTVGRSTGRVMWECATCGVYALDGEVRFWPS
jgi:hypothetical protein